MQTVLVTQDMHLRTKLNKVLDLQVTTCKSKESFLKLLTLPLYFDSTVFIDDRMKENHELICFIMSNFPEIKIFLLLSRRWIKQPFIEQGNLCFLQRPVNPKFFTSFKAEPKIEDIPSFDLNKVLIGNSDSMRKIKKMIYSLGKNNLNVFIYGETGTGKDVVARAIHKLRHPDIDMVAESCSFLNGSLSESMLFGHHKGSFTGAIDEQEGLITQANGSTLFLDEIEELSVEGQAKMLRLLENGEYRCIGNNELQYSHFGLITASNVSSKTLIEQKKLRKDFFHRISTIKLALPPLRERIEDIPALTKFYETKRGYQSFIKAFDNLFLYSWPGNVRELFAAIDRIHCLDPSNLLPTKDIIENTNYVFY